MKIEKVQIRVVVVELQQKLLALAEYVNSRWWTVATLNDFFVEKKSSSLFLNTFVVAATISSGKEF